MNRSITHTVVVKVKPAWRHPVTPWGKPTKGSKTRSKKKPSGKFIVKRRK